MLDRADMADATLVLTEDDGNLVQVAKEKYILNWKAEDIVNTFTKVKIKRQYQQHQIT
jgi:ribose 5-phosphate isomerase RpiB